MRGHSPLRPGRQGEARGATSPPAAPPDRRRTPSRAGSPRRVPHGAADPRRSRTQPSSSRCPRCAAARSVRHRRGRRRASSPRRARGPMGRFRRAGRLPRGCAAWCPPAPEPATARTSRPCPAALAARLDPRRRAPCPRTPAPAPRRGGAGASYCGGCVPARCAARASDSAFSRARRAIARRM